MLQSRTISAEGPGTGKREALLIVLLAVLSAVLLFGLRSNQQLGDSLVYTVSVETGENLYHPHHLLYNPAIKLVRSVMSVAETAYPELLAAQVHNVIWALVAVLSMFVLVRKLTGLPGLAFLAGLALLVTNGLWELSTQATLYSSAAAVPLLLAAVVLERSERSITIPRAFLVCLLLALAVLYHQANILLCLPLACYLIAREGKRGFKILIAATSGAGLLVLLVYVLAFVATNGSWSLAGFVHFCTAYASEICWGGECVASPETWGTLSHISLAGVGVLLQSMLWNYVGLPERFAAPSAYLLGAGLLALCAYHLSRVRKGGHPGQVRAYLLIWAGSYVLFLWWWLPDYSHPLLIPTMPVVVLLFLFLADIKDRSFIGLSLKPVLVLATMTVFAGAAAVNLYLRVLPMHANPSDSYVEAAELTSFYREPVQYFASYRVWNHLRYYFGKRGAARLGKYPLIYFYTEKPLPDIYREQSGALLVDTQFVRPDYPLTGYAETPLTGYEAPGAWLRYLEWLFDLEYDEDRQLKASRVFRTIKLFDGQLYLLILPEKQNVDGLENLLGELDAQYAQHPDATSSPYASWMRAASSKESATVRGVGAP